MSRARTVGLILGAVLVLAGLFMPGDWYQPLTREDAPTPAISGLALVRGALVLEGLLCLALGALGWSYRRIEPGSLLRVPDIEPGELSQSRARTALIGITVLAAVLRFVELGADLWLDEIAPVMMYRDVSYLEVAISYIASNNHLLNTLLVKLGTDLFGEHEWSIRLAAVTFGTLSVPAFYYLCRETSSRVLSLGCALLLAVSYHHIFFSQNARGYTPYVFFALTSTIFLSRALQRDRAKDWVIYVVMALLGFSSLLVSAFVLAAQGMVAAWAVFSVWRRGDAFKPLLGRLALVFGVIGLLSFHLYAPVLPQAYAYITENYARASVGYSPLSLEFIKVMVDGVLAGLGPAAVIGGLLGAPLPLVGLISLLRRNWVVPATLILPAVLQISLLVVRGLSTSPRLLILCLPALLLLIVAGVHEVTRWAARKLNKPDRWARTAWSVVMGAAVVLSAVSLRFYYAHPKQDYRGAITFVEAERAPEETVVVLHLAEKGFRYYGDEGHLRRGSEYHYLRTQEEFERVLRAPSKGNLYAVTTLHRILRIELPEIWSELREHWERVKVLPGTLGDGEVFVWRRRTDAAQ